MSDEFNGLGLNLGNLSTLSNAVSRSISAENPDGAKGKGGMSVENLENSSARELGQGWKVKPCITLPGKSTTTLADIEGPGAIQQFWITTFPEAWRRIILRFYWDDETTPSVEVPLGDFFCNGWCKRAHFTSLPIAVNPAGGFNSYWEMPFRKHAKMTVENLGPEPIPGFFYQVNYTLTEVPENRAYFHAQWRRNNPLKYMDVHTLLDGVKGEGHYVGTYLAWGVNNNGWWGEGEIKFYFDGDDQFPTICGTGTEDYFGGAWDFEFPKGEYAPFWSAYSGLMQVIIPDGLYSTQQRFGMYRWHIMDPIRFKSELKVTIQALGWRSALEGKRRYLPMQDDIASTSFWYQTEPHAVFPALPGINDLEVI